MVSSQKNDSLKLNGGRFSSQNFEPGTSNPGMNDALNKYFSEDLPDGYEVYNLGTLDTKKNNPFGVSDPLKLSVSCFTHQQ